MTSRPSRVTHTNHIIFQKEENTNHIIFQRKEETPITSSSNGKKKKRKPNGPGGMRRSSARHRASMNPRHLLGGTGKTKDKDKRQTLLKRKVSEDEESEQRLPGIADEDDTMDFWVNRTDEIPPSCCACTGSCLINE
jgi:hypothetical protein